MSQPLQLLLRFALSAVSVLIVAAVLPGFKVKSFSSAFLFAVVVAIFNVIAWKVLALLSLPFVVVTAGIGYFIVNGLVFLAAQKVTKGVEISGCVMASIAAIAVGFVNTAVNALIQ